MRPYFNTSEEIATSSLVEAEFFDLKCRGFKNRHPIRVDKFVIEHLEYLNTKISLACNKRDKNSENSTAEPLNESIKNYKNDIVDSKKSLSDCNEQDTNNSLITNSNNDTAEPLNKSIKNYKNDIVDSEESLSDCNDKYTWNITENWHGLVRSNGIKNECQEDVKSIAKTRSKLSYLDKCPEWDFLKNIKSLNLPLMINGSKCKPITKGVVTVEK
ncbi:hypothetical protein PUN28_019424 [Cardiocondyla obscurior]|uniref:Uncharacterized protein n=1 Tax=Cardiocondyla obscurior TaxID=286306 RepID=A0AAW2EE50_9HYME